MILASSTQPDLAERMLCDATQSTPPSGAARQALSPANAQTPAAAAQSGTPASSLSSVPASRIPSVCLSTACDVRQWQQCACRSA